MGDDDDDEEDDDEDGTGKKTSALTVENVKKFNDTAPPAPRLSLAEVVAQATGIDFAARRQARIARLAEISKEDDYSSGDNKKPLALLRKNFRTWVDASTSSESEEEEKKEEEEEEEDENQMLPKVDFAARRLARQQEREFEKAKEKKSDWFWN